MATIVIKDLEENRELDRKALASVKGGSAFTDAIVYGNLFPNSGYGTILNSPDLLMGPSGAFFAGDPINSFTGLPATYGSYYTWGPTSFDSYSYGMPWWWNADLIL